MPQRTVQGEGDGIGLSVSLTAVFSGFSGCRRLSEWLGNPVNSLCSESVLTHWSVAVSSLSEGIVALLLNGIVRLSKFLFYVVNQ